MTPTSLPSPWPITRLLWPDSQRHTDWLAIVRNDAIYAEHGLAYVAELRKTSINKSSIFPADMLDQMERQLRAYINQDV